MKVVRGSCCEPRLEFNDIRQGDTIEFPYHPEWKDRGIFLRIYTSASHGQKNRHLSSLHLTRLDDAPGSSSCDSNGTVCGSTYTISRKSYDDSADYKFQARRINISICVEEKQ